MDICFPYMDFYVKKYKKIKNMIQKAVENGTAAIYIKGGNEM